MSDGPQVVIVGAGFGGLWALQAFWHTNFRVLLIDRNNYHTFLPLLYQVAAAEVEPEEIVYPVRSFLRPYRNADFLLAEVESIDYTTHTINTSSGTVHYDYLILAAGSTTNFYGVAGTAEHAFPLKSLDDGVQLRNHILCSVERAAREPDPERRRALLTFAIVGGGPTGVEFAGALSELLRGPLQKDFPGLDLHQARVILMESSERLIASMPPRLSEYARKRLQKMGVEVHVKTLVDRVDAGAVHIRDGDCIPTETTVWTAGVRGEPSAAGWGLPLDRAGRVAISPTLEVEGLIGVYAVGDLARSNENGKPLPMVAQVAMQQGRVAAENIKRRVDGKSPVTFHYHDLGMMATLGRNAAIASTKGIDFTGFPAWLAWLGVHLAKLIGFRNRLVVLFAWALDYFFFERTIRLILPASSCRQASEPVRRTAS
jgi:NADH:ubiquinone reductase (H+-translocating)